MKKSFSRLILISFSLISLSSNATGFLPQEPRGLAMGGAGVAVGNSRQAHYYNPALLRNAPDSEDFSFEIDVAFRASDNDKLIDAADKFDKANPIINFSTSLNEFDTTPTLQNLQNAINASKDLQNHVVNVTNKSLTLDLNAGLFASVPNKTYSWAVYYNVWGNLGAAGILSDADNTSVNAFITAAQNVANAGGATIDPNDVNTILNLDPSQALSSSVLVQGAYIGELGVAIAFERDINNYTFDIGVTPKFQQVTTFGAQRTLKELESGKDLTSRDQTKTFNTFNLDLGISKQLDDNWESGVVIKNLIPKSFDTPTNKDVEIKPAARIGAAYHNNWLNVGADFDLTENSDIATSSKSRFLAVGIEADVWVLQLRGGYRHNLSSSGGSGPSIGLGLYLAGLNIDAALAANDLGGSEITDFDNINASLQLGFNW